MQARLVRVAACSFASPGSIPAAFSKAKSRVIYRSAADPVRACDQPQGRQGVPLAMASAPGHHQPPIIHFLGTTGFATVPKSLYGSKTAAGGGSRTCVAGCVQSSIKRGYVTAACFERPAVQKPNYRHRRLLRARRERPRCRRPAEQRDEFAPFHCLVPPVLSNERITHQTATLAGFQSGLHRSKKKCMVSLFDHPVGACQYCVGYRDAKCFCRP
jgi:hypothetical protein